ncbi:chemotaxis protein histidine kinase CheA [Flavobacterium nitrogenifigens]|uniref:Chemotaxis protein histidine kinase CheA n=2 Tax=Flavobacterium TaxID=237 RepID=A0A7W7N7E7_9FLAO|nr:MULTISPECIES: hypothetical protein [Flavobacterium]MBB4801227.1 chemotaxis protein histidine kinase CheA [Flavobacterium nitrogenifigens]MBB6385025.1 chemotaxis protein histidine kinase CheA [Flavobacterium notoginsengisoli]
MKKKLEADLISIAHRILKLKNKSDINQLYLETQKLYEKLAVLKFVEENFDAAKPTIGQNDIASELEMIFDKEEETIPTLLENEAPIAETVIALEETYEPEISEESPAEVVEAAEPITEIAEPVIEETTEPIVAEIIEPEAEKEIEQIEESKNKIDELSFTTVNDLKPIPDFKPAFELETEEIKDEVKEEPKAKTAPIPTILFEDFGVNYADAQFVKVDSFEAIPPAKTPSINDFKEEKKEEKIEAKKVETAILETPAQSKPVSLNEKLARGFHIDLNDRIAFTKNLFGNSTEDYSRVLNQLLTFDSYAEAQEFIENMVKPDYNNWEGKDDYAERFLGIIEKKFA